MRSFIIVYAIFLFSQCKPKVNLDTFRGYVADAGNTRLLLEDMESLWAGGGTSQKLSIIHNGFIVYDTLIISAHHFLVDSVIIGKPNHYLLKRFSWENSLKESKGSLYADKNILVEYSIISIDHSISPFYDSCFQIRYGESDVQFYSEKEKKWVSFPKYKIKFISRSEVMIRITNEPYMTMTFRMDEKLAKELISNLAKGQ